MAHVGLDLLDYAGKKHLVCVDKWSGFPLYKIQNSTTTQSIINVMETWFNILGWPSKSDLTMVPKKILHINYLPPTTQKATA